MSSRSSAESVSFEASRVDAAAAPPVRVVAEQRRKSLVRGESRRRRGRATPLAQVADRNRVGEDLGLDFENNPNDVYLSGDADDVVAALAAETGWLGDLAAFEDALPDASRETLRRARAPGTT